MIYLSKGMKRRNTKEQQRTVFYCGERFLLTEAEAELWSRGRFSIARTKRDTEERMLTELERMGLVEVETEDDAVARYWILTRCICYQTERSSISLPVWGVEKTLLAWLRHAGIRLTVAELIFLMEHQIKPQPGLLCEENRQELVELIYTRENVMDHLLEYQMERAASRDVVVRGLLRLLKKRKIVLL